MTPVFEFDRPLNVDRPEILGIDKIFLKESNAPADRCIRDVYNLYRAHIREGRMQIPSHQIHNVLKVYSKQLSQTRMLGRQKALTPQETTDKISLSAMGKRQAIIDKVAADIVERITQSGPQDRVDQEIVGKLEDELGQSIDFKDDSNSFTFNAINRDNEKTTNTLHVGDADYLIKRLEQLAREAVDKNMES